MREIRVFLLVFFLTVICQHAYSFLTIQCYSDSLTTIDTTNKSHKNIHGFVAVSAIATGNQQVPLWMRSMQNGSISLSGLSASVFAAAYKNYSPQQQQKLLDWGIGFNMRANVEKNFELYLIEAYAKARLSIFQLSVGRTRDITGLVDSTLSTGAFSLSGNALGIPKIEISTHGYWDLPLTNKLIALNAKFTHGWAGERINTYNKRSGKVERYTTYFHQKTLYGRFGKPHWKIHLYGGFNHFAMWGSEQKMFEEFGLTEWETFCHVFYGKDYGGQGIHNTKIGNHLGSIDQALEINSKQLQIFAYHQFYYEAGALYKLANIKDGTWGLSIKNKNLNKYFVNWNKIIFEFIYSKSQGGEIAGPVRPSPFEDYYNNSYYKEGWTNNEENMGNILFTSKKYIREELPQPSNYIFANNRIGAIHTAFDFDYNKWRIIIKLTFSKNFGHYFTSPEHRGFGSQIVYHSPPYFGQVSQFNGYFGTMYPLKKGWKVNMAFAIDRGRLLYNSVGGEVKVVKRW